MASTRPYRTFLAVFSVIGLAVSLALSITASTATASARDGVYSVTVFSYDMAPVIDVAAILAPAKQDIDGGTLLRTPDDMTFAKINQMALRPSFAWEVALKNGAWRRISI